MREKDKSSNNRNENKIDKELLRTLNITSRKFICIDSEATLRYKFLKVGDICLECIFDINGEKNLIPHACYLLIVHGHPFYIEKRFVCRYDEENDERRKVLQNLVICVN